MNDDNDDDDNKNVITQDYWVFMLKTDNLSGRTWVGFFSASINCLRINTGMQQTN